MSGNRTLLLCVHFLLLKCERNRERKVEEKRDKNRDLINEETIMTSILFNRMNFKFCFFKFKGSDLFSIKPKFVTRMQTIFLGIQKSIYLLLMTWIRRQKERKRKLTKYDCKSCSCIVCIDQNEYAIVKTNSNSVYSIIGSHRLLFCDINSKNNT